MVVNCIRKWKHLFSGSRNFKTVLIFQMIASNELYNFSSQKVMSGLYPWHVILSLPKKMNYWKVWLLQSRVGDAPRRFRLPIRPGTLTTLAVGPIIGYTLFYFEQSTSFIECTVAGDKWRQIGRTARAFWTGNTYSNKHFKIANVYFKVIRFN